MFTFNTNNHTATKVCFTKSHYYACQDFFYYTQAGLEACPEYQAYKKCFEAYNKTLDIVPENVSDSLKAEADAWKKSTISKMANISKINWKLDDYNGCHNPFTRFKGEIVSIEIIKEWDDTFIEVSSNTQYNIKYRFSICEDKSNEVKIEPGMIILENEIGEKGYFIFAE